MQKRAGSDTRKTQARISKNESGARPRIMLSRIPRSPCDLQLKHLQTPAKQLQRFGVLALALVEQAQVVESQAVGTV
jgi:hypothetical protein